MTFEELQKENEKLKQRVEMLEKDFDLQNKMIERLKSELKKVRVAYIQSCVCNIVHGMQKHCETCKHWLGKLTAEVFGEERREPCRGCDGFDKWEEP